MKIYTVDAFTEMPFSGNPAGVVILDRPVEDELMQNIAMEMNYSETAFICKENSGYRLKWFTPTREVDICGHATLAGAHILIEQNIADKTGDISFFTKSGTLIARKQKDMLVLDFPSLPPAKCSAPNELAKSFDVEFIYTGKNKLGYIVEIASEQELLNLKPDFNLLKTIDVMCTIVTCRSRYKEYDFISRVFAPALSIDEDPVTGAAHCTLAPYWRDKLNKKSFTAYQASKRGGKLKLEIANDHILLKGNCITMFKIQMLI